MSKAKGSKGERDLMKFFWENGWACVRSAGSGSTSFPSPDLIAGNKIRRVAVECKVTKDDSKYFTKDEIRQLRAFSDYFGTEPWVAVKLSKEPWYFLSLDDLKETDKNFVATLSLCRTNGLLTEEFFS
ncbi:Holliday junction resolvase [Candidatus Woesearchaeota archaeon]|nr:Holliday junction resolvase [Candidatus Woesearchaeota archaeon]